MAHCGRAIAAILVVLWCVTAGFVPTWAQTAMPTGVPVRFTADEVSYDRDLGITTASGNVEVTQEDRVLLADTITYNQRLDILTATGNVSLLDGSGDVVFAQHVELTGDMKDGIIEDFRMILKDGSRVAAAGGRRANYDLDLRKSVYSPCNLCPENPTRPPLWQVKAIRVFHRKAEQIVEYSDAWLEVAGIPVAYTPYLSHPDPTVRRKSGFLPPTIGSSSDLGPITKVPYFWAITPYSDATLTPAYFWDQGPGFAGEYRHRFQEGRADISGSIVDERGDRGRGHIKSKGRFDLDDTWRWGFDVHAASDDTYLRRYRYESEATLVSDVFAEGFRRRNYFVASSYAFQGLEQNVETAKTPVVVPLMEYSHVGEAGRYGGRTKLDSSLLSLYRIDGTDTRRLSVRPGWELPYTAPAGDVYTLSASLNGDFYEASQVNRGLNKTPYSGFSGRVVPEAKLDWRYPFAKHGGSVAQVIEPIATFIVSPNGGNDPKIPNEDSIAFEFDDTNLFSANRFTGIDRVEGGSRVHYGLKWGLYGNAGGSTSLLVGQSYRPRTDDTFGPGTGLEDHFSDIVGKLHVSPGKNIDLLYRTRLNKDNFGAERNEFLTTVGAPALRVTANYTLFNRTPDTRFPTREQLSLSVASQLTRYWRVQAGGTRDLAENEMRSIGTGLTYEDECLIFTTTAARSFFSDRDLRPNDTILFRVMFKTLGEFQSSAKLF